MVRFLGYTIAAGDLAVLIYEFAAMGTLHDALHGTHAFSPSFLPAGLENYYLNRSNFICAWCRTQQGGGGPRAASGRSW